MMLKEWLLAIRILNVLTAACMIAFEAWFAIELLGSGTGLANKVIRMFMPVFVAYPSADAACSPPPSSLRSSGTRRQSNTSSF